MRLVVILVPNESEDKQNELRAICQTRSELFFTFKRGGYYLALAGENLNGDGYTVFSGPMAVVEYGPPVVSLIDLERGCFKYVRRDHLNTALAFQFVVRAF